MTGTLIKRCSILFVVALLLLDATISMSAVGAITGWEVDSPYNKLYNPKERDEIKGDIVKFIEIRPLPGMAPGTAFMLDEGGGDKVLVHVCPKTFATAREIGIKRGDWVKIKGVWADIGNETVFIAAKIKKDSGFEFKVRLTGDGTPFWTMSPEELAKERAKE